jgi:hypothetical protein
MGPDQLLLRRGYRSRRLALLKIACSAQQRKIEGRDLDRMHGVASRFRRLAVGAGQGVHEPLAAGVRVAVNNQDSPAHRVRNRVA